MGRFPLAVATVCVITMDLKQLFKDDDAVSPVIGVILMVAITVILAAVIASFVLGLGDQAQNNAPQASFGWDYDGDAQNVTVSHESGSSIEASALDFRGDGLRSGDGHVNSSSSEWPAIKASGSNSQVVAGDSVDVSVNDDYDLSLVYQEAGSDQSTTLASDTGPAA